jgi:hypothetical protein
VSSPTMVTTKDQVEPSMIRLETVMNSLDAFLRVPTQESKVGAKFLRYLSFPTLGNGAT